MGQMKWIYTMVQNGSYSIFKTMYETAFKNDVDSFTFENREFSTIIAKHICTLGDKAQKDYDEHIDNMADSEYDSHYLEQ
jgi:hypothetical protein